MPNEKNCEGVWVWRLLTRESSLRRPLYPNLRILPTNPTLLNRFAAIVAIAFSLGGCFFHSDKLESGHWVSMRHEQIDTSSIWGWRGTEVWFWSSSQGIAYATHKGKIHIYDFASGQWLDRTTPGESSVMARANWAWRLQVLPTRVRRGRKNRRFCFLSKMRRSQPSKPASRQVTVAFGTIQISLPRISTG